MTQDEYLKTLTPEKLIKMEFVDLDAKPDDYDFSRGNILISRNRDEDTLLIEPGMGSIYDYGAKCKGILSDQDLLTLCRLVNGTNS